MDEHRIEKETREAIFCLSDGSEIQGEVFFRLYEAEHSGLQKLSDLLNEESPFIPVRTAKGLTLLSLYQIVSAAMSDPWEKDGLLILGKRKTVRIRMAGGREIDGEIFINLPEGYDRVKDYVNQHARFLPVFQPNRIVFINQSLILSVQD